MTLVANPSGVVEGKFTIPPNVAAGTKLVRFAGSGGSYGSANFVGQGVLTTNTMQQQTTVRTVLSPAPMPVGIDPLAQTFSLQSATQVGGVDLFVTAKGATPFIVQLRETQVGLPTRTVLAETQLRPEQIAVNAWNRFAFQMPVSVMPDIEYAIVVLCNDADGAVAVAELGKYDTAAGAWVTNQPYQVGVLLSSSNASTWTPHQDRDMTFRLLAARYTQSVREIDLGSVAVTSVTDLLVLSVNDQPSVDSGSEIELTFPDATKLAVSDGQVVRLASPVTGNVGVKARLRATQAVSAIMAPGLQVVAGQLAGTGDYVSRAFDADAAGATVRVIFDAILPSGSGVQVFVAGVDAGDTWTPVTQDGSAKPLGDSKFEYQYLATGVMEARVRVKLVLTGTIAARPQVSNLRVSVT